MKVKFKKVIVLFITMVTIGFLAACGDLNLGSTLDKDTIVVGFDDTFVPMGYRNEKGDFEGFDIELAKAVAEKMNKNIEFQPIDWLMKESELRNGNIDVIWNGFSITDERKETLDFSNPYLQNRQAIIVLNESTINKKEDLKGRVVAAQAQSSAVDAIGEYEENFKELITFSTNDEALRDLQAGRCDAVVADEILSRYYINLKGEENFRVLDEDFGEEEYAIGVRKNDTDFLDALNKAYEEVVKDGTASKISEKWFGEDLIEK